MLPIYALVVIYNKSCADSTSCQCLQDFKGINVIIADNSTVINDNKEYAESRGWKYVSMGGNKGLSKAYNRGIMLVDKPNAIVCLFDDDTEISSDYFDLLTAKAVQEPDTKIFLPCVYDEIGLLSPSIIDGLAVRRVSSVDIIMPEHINGINSGMAIRADVFENYYFDERYFLDYIDHAFLRDMKRMGHRISFFNARLKQSFFDNSCVDIKSAINRFKIFRRDFKRFCGSSCEGRRFYYREIINRKKAMYLKYKKIKVLFI